MKRKILVVISILISAFALGGLVFGHLLTYNKVVWEITRSDTNCGVKNLSIFGTNQLITKGLFSETIEESTPWKIGCEFDSLIYDTADRFNIEIQDSDNFKTYESILPITSSDSWGPVGVRRVIIQLKNDKNWIIIRNGQTIILKVFITKRYEKKRFFSRLEKIMSV